MLAVVFGVAMFERGKQKLGAFDKTLARLALIDAKPGELKPGNAAADTKDEASPRQIVEQRNLGRDAHRIVPRDDDRRRAERDPRRARGNKRQRLDGIGPDDVPAEMMLRTPERVITGGFGFQSDVHVPV